MAEKILVKQIKAISGRTPEVRDTIKALGLGKIGKQRTFEMNPALYGMLRKVRYLIEVSKL